MLDNVCTLKIIRVFIIKTCAYFNNTGSIKFFSSWGKWANFPRCNFQYRASFFRFFRGFAGEFVSLLLAAFILYTCGSAICFARPRTVFLGIISASSLKLATIKSTQLLDAGVNVWLPGDVTLEGSCVPGSTRESVRAESSPSIAIRAGSTQTSGGEVVPSHSLTYLARSVYIVVLL